ncbi:MAG TPA: hypothetical protein VMS32_10165 [Verrucomicrobiae bacterium]|nr:hypothetical protein [Verrucomicrobiae bacterium]
MNYRKVVRSIVLAVCACILIGVSLNPAGAATDRFISVTNGTPGDIGVTFTQAGVSKSVAEGTVPKFDRKSFRMPDQFTTVRISSMKGCSAVTRDVPVGKSGVTVRENCAVQIE